ncbi:MAG TPA: hypothetical protein VG839_06995 [Asticcacaulis sp.]|nr:hypothetical protein [Asticcacaulis sp.]
MLKTVLFAVVAWLAVQPALAFAADDAEARYQSLLAAAKAGAPVNWQTLRFAYAERPSYVMDGDRDERAAMFKAINADDWTGALAAANRVLDKNYCSGLGHFGAAMADDKLGRAADSDREKQIARAIFASIKTGDGLSFEQAFTVISVGEEYDTFTTLGIDPGNQSLSKHDGHMYDVFVTKDEAGKPVTYYFNIDRVWAAEARMMGGK